ncbi:MAG TPA: hypothetical protein VNM87_05120, partial [Candidatus Udaeobacter sp.]|nr:hypothetical protein [Candidatus Udaeobacter sp.]
PDLAAARRLRARTPLPLAVAGGITTRSHVEALAAIGAQAVVSATHAAELAAAPDAERVR